MRKASGFSTAHSLLLSMSAVIALSISNAHASTTPSDATQCAEQFEDAQKNNMAAFKNYDKDAFHDLRNDKAIAIFASGYRFYGLNNIMQALSAHFSNKKAQWSWTEQYRFIDGCKTAFIVYETNYDKEHSLTSVTFTYNNDQWQVIKDQGTLLPVAP